MLPDTPCEGKKANKSFLSTHQAGFAQQREKVFLNWEGSHRNSLSNMDETVYLHDISHPLYNVSEIEE